MRTIDSDPAGDPKTTMKEDLAQLNRARCHNELDLQSIKSTMHRDVLRCKTPELVHHDVKIAPQFHLSASAKDSRDDRCHRLRRSACHWAR